MTIFTTFRILVLALFLATPLINTAAPAVEALQNTASNFYTIRRDARRCAAPRCGGYFVKLVNQSRTRCANGSYMTECYVASIDWNAQPEPQKNGALVRGSLTTGDTRFGLLTAQEVWVPAGDRQPSGTYYRVRDRGLRCIAAPCETHSETKLNTAVTRNIAGVDLSGAGAPESLVSEAQMTMTGQDGVLVVGVHTRVTGPAGRSQMLKASQFYLRSKPETSTANPGPPASGQNQKPCFKTGCSGQVCADEEMITTCEFKPEYECYKTAKCERQSNGKCGFTETPELRRCLRRN